MKKALVLALVLLGVFCFATAAFAEGFTVGGDYTMTAPNNRRSRGCRVSLAWRLI